MGLGPKVKVRGVFSRSIYKFNKRGREVWVPPWFGEISGGFADPNWLGQSFIDDINILITKDLRQNDQE